MSPCPTCGTPCVVDLEDPNVTQVRAGVFYVCCSGCGRRVVVQL